MFARAALSGMGESATVRRSRLIGNQKAHATKDVGHANQRNDIERVSQLLIGDPPFAGIVNQIQPSEVHPNEGDEAGYYHRGYLSCSTCPRGCIDRVFSFHVACSGLMP